MPELMVRNYAGVDEVVTTRLQHELDGRTMLGDVLAWGRSLNPPQDVQDVITQDEYTHDVVFAYADGLYVVFDTT